MVLRIAGGLFLSLLLAGCAGTRAPPAEAPAPVLGNESLEMNGRWKLTAPNAPSCGMLFESLPQPNQGTIKPEGGCPGQFFTSRHWTLTGGQLTISDHNQSPLARLKLSDGYFSGKSVSGMPMTLSRYSLPAS